MKCEQQKWSFDIYSFKLLTLAVCEAYICERTFSFFIYLLPVKEIYLKKKELKTSYKQ